VDGADIAHEPEIAASARPLNKRFLRARIFRLPQ
jgi:hypothetical protein